MRVWKLFFILLLLLPVCCYAQKTILWKVTDAGGKHTSYLFGTLHQMGNSFADSLPVIRKSILECNVAVFERLESGTLVAMLNARQPDSAYARELKKEDVDALHKLSAGWSVPVSKVSPSELMIKLQQLDFEKHCGTIKPTDTWKVLDNYLQHIAEENGLKTIGLESDSMMTAAVNASQSADWALFQKPIHQQLERIETDKGTKRQCSEALAYTSFNVDYQFDEPCGNSPILSERNKNWLQITPSLLEQNNCFIAVGLMHLYGECGLIVQLRKMGYTIAEVKMR